MVKHETSQGVTDEDDDKREQEIDTDSTPQEDDCACITNENVLGKFDYVSRDWEEV